MLSSACKFEHFIIGCNEACSHAVKYRELRSLDYLSNAERRGGIKETSVINQVLKFFLFCLGVVHMVQLTADLSESVPLLFVSK